MRLAWTQQDVERHQARVHGQQIAEREIVVRIVAMGKPRMTKSDRWKKRPCVLQYREWCDALREQAGLVPDRVAELHWVAYMPFPRSYSLKKRTELKGQIHQEKPDRDNIDKAICDALFREDKCIAIGSQRKLWDDGLGPRIVIRMGM